MKHDLTTGTWQDDTGCPISIILVSTSDALRWLVVVFSAKQKEQRTPPAANQRQHHLVYVYVSHQLGLILTYLQYRLDQF